MLKVVLALNSYNIYFWTILMILITRNIHLLKLGYTCTQDPSCNISWFCSPLQNFGIMYSPVCIPFLICSNKLHISAPSISPIVTFFSWKGWKDGEPIVSLETGADPGVMNSHFHAFARGPGFDSRTSPHMSWIHTFMHSWITHSGINHQSGQEFNVKPWLLCHGVFCLLDDMLQNHQLHTLTSTTTCIHYGQRGRNNKCWFLVTPGFSNRGHAKDYRMMCTVAAAAALIPISKREVRDQCKAREAFRCSLRLFELYFEAF